MTNNKNKPNFILIRGDGAGCTCEAHDWSECGCDADWTPTEVYELRDKVKLLTQQVDKLKEKLRIMTGKK